MGALASSAAGNFSGHAAGEKGNRCVSDDVYSAVELLGRRGGECSAFISVMPKSFPKSLCQITLPPGVHESSGCISSLSALGIIYFFFSHSDVQWSHNVLFICIYFPGG